MNQEKRDICFQDIDPFDYDAYKVACGEDVPLFVYTARLGRYLYARKKYPHLNPSDAIAATDEDSIVRVKEQPLNIINNVILTSCCGGGEVR